MPNALHTETKNGLTLSIYADNGGTDCPLDGDDAIVFASYSRRNGATFYAPDDIKATYNLKDMEEAQRFTADYSDTDAEWKVFALWAYDHSGIAFRAAELNTPNPFLGRAQHAEWDSGRAGIIAVKLSEIGNDPLENVNATLDTYNDWVNGNVHGYTITDADGKELDSCWGYIGDYDADVLTSARVSLDNAASSKAHTEKAYAKEFGVTL